MVDTISAFFHGLQQPLMLWLLSRRPRYGYELIKQFRRLTGEKLKPSTVYSFLHWLEKEGFAVSKCVEKGRRKTIYYSLTGEGKKLLKRAQDFFKKPIQEVINDLVMKTETPS